MLERMGKCSQQLLESRSLVLTAAFSLLSFPNHIAVCFLLFFSMPGRAFYGGEVALGFIAARKMAPEQDAVTPHVLARQDKES